MTQNHGKRFLAVFTCVCVFIAFEVTAGFYISSNLGRASDHSSGSIPWITSGKRTKTTISWPLTEPFKITNLDLAFGEQQVELMVHDRPEMARLISSRDPIWIWCARNFGGVSLGQHLYWSNAKPAPPDFGADHKMPFSGKPGFIRVDELRRSDGHDSGRASCEELWAKAVFELNNMSNDIKFLQIYRDGIDGKLNRDQFIERNTRLEYLTERKTALVHEHVWITNKARLGPDSQYWGVYVPDNYEDWISQYTDRSSYPWVPFGSYYDEQLVPYLRGMGK